MLYHYDQFDVKLKQSVWVQCLFVWADQAVVCSSWRWLVSSQELSNSLKLWTDIWKVPPFHQVPPRAQEALLRSTVPTRSHSTYSWLWHSLFNTEMLSRRKQRLKVAFYFSVDAPQGQFVTNLLTMKQANAPCEPPKVKSSDMLFSTVSPSLWKLWNRQRSRLDAPFTDLCCHQSRLLTLQ